jgi:hypothetical protein
MGTGNLSGHNLANIFPNMTMMSINATSHEERNSQNKFDNRSESGSLISDHSKPQTVNKSNLIEEIQSTYSNISNKKNTLRSSQNKNEIYSKNKGRSLGGSLALDQSTHHHQNVQAS